MTHPHTGLTSLTAAPGRLEGRCCSNTTLLPDERAHLRRESSDASEWN